MLRRRGKHRIGQAAVANDTIGSKAYATSRRNHAGAPISKHVAVGRDLDLRAGGQEVRHDDIRRARDCVPNTMIIGVGRGKS
jgi:hypothetical protein